MEGLYGFCQTVDSFQNIEIELYNELCTCRISVILFMSFECSRIVLYSIYIFILILIIKFLKSFLFMVCSQFKSDLFYPFLQYVI